MKERQIAKAYEGKKPSWVMVCSYCGRQPHEIREYVYCAAAEGMTPEEYVKMDEGTYNEEDNTFCCTECFIKHGF